MDALPPRWLTQAGCTCPTGWSAWRWPSARRVASLRGQIGDGISARTRRIDPWVHGSGSTSVTAEGSCFWRARGPALKNCYWNSRKWWRTRRSSCTVLFPCVASTSTHNNLIRRDVVCSPTTSSLSFLQAGTSYRGFTSTLLAVVVLTILPSEMLSAVLSLLLTHSACFGGLDKDEVGWKMGWF